MHAFWLTVIIIFLNIIFSLSLIFIERKNPTTTWAWLLIFIILPGIGFIIYVLLGQNFSRQKLFREKSIIDEYKKKVLETQKFDRLDLKKYNCENADLMKMNFNNCGSRYTSRNEVKVFDRGEDKFKSLLEDIKNAKKYINIQYYIFKKDSIGSEIIEALEKKLEEGVEVRLLVDAMGSRGMTKKKLKRFLELGGEFAVFFPGILPHINTRVNYRNHRKIVVIDGEYGYVGGFNVGDEYLGRDKKIGNWRDTHIRIRGNAVIDLNERFVLDWCYASNKEITELDKFIYEGDLNSGDVGIQIVTSGPDHNEEYIKNAYVKMITNAKRNIFLTTPYFIPDDTMIESLRIAALSGVEVKIIIPGEPDHKFMAWAASSYIGELLEAGVRVFYYENGFVHAKVLVVDEMVSSIGTANMDIRSFRLNFEVNSFIYDEEISSKVVKSFERDLTESREISVKEYNERSITLKVLESITRLLSPIL
ncbi:MAG: cardiolipin synthase [Clostridium sp.]|uniref:cardiolipin synthase n=1 Tax=Clostridium sp. TaxID=1506 RepID=UPI003EE70163